MKIELRSDSVFISGYVNAVGRDSRPIVSPNGKFVEMIEPGTFNEALTRAQNVDLLLNHDKNKKLGSTSDGNLKLTEDSIGLRAECEVRDAGVIEKARKKQLRGWSFGMYVNKADMENRAENVPRRHIRALDLFEVSIIDNQMLPCYAGTSVECRADGDVMSEMRATDDTEHEITEVKAADPVEPADYSEWEKRAAEFANAPYEKRLEELRYNPYHDPTNGKFTSGSGGGAGYLFVGKGAKGAGQYVVDSSYFAADKPKFLPEEIEETVDGYKITDKTVSSERGEVSNSGKYTEIKSLPPKNQAQINKIAKEKGIEDPVLVGGRMVVPRKVGDKAVAINQQARDNYKANLKNNVPGLDELEKVKADYNAEQRLFSKSIENGNGILHSPKVTSADVAEVGKKYPVASAYLKADGYSNSANYHKASAGETAKDRIRRGENYKQVLEDMEKEWEKSVEEHIWD